LLRSRRVPPTIPERRDQRAQRATRPSRQLAFDQTIYAQRNVVARGINRLKQWRGLATGYLGTCGPPSLFLGQHGIPDEALDWVARAQGDPGSR
jgi:transposase